MRRTIVATLAAIMLIALATSAAAQTTTIPIATNAVIADNATATVPFTFGGGGYITEVRVGVRIDHPRLADLTLTLRAPGDRDILLTDAVSGANMGTGSACAGPLTVFRAAATTAIGAGTAPYIGEFRPQGSLNSLQGIPAAGNWQLLVSDGATGMTGFVRCFSLTLTTTPGIELTTTADVVNPDDGVIALREAFAIASSDGRASTIVLRPRSTYPITCGGGRGGLSLAGTETVILRGFGSTVSTAGCAQPLLGGTAAGLQVDQLNLRTTGASGPAIDFGTVIANAVDIRGPFLTGIKAGSARGTAVLVRGMRDDGVAATGTANLTGVTIAGNGGDGVQGATIQVTQSDIQGNRAAGVNGPTVSVSASSLTGSPTGALVTGGGTFAQTTITGNATGIGGAGGRVSLDHATVAGNSTDDIGAALTAATAKASAIGTCGRALTSMGHNAAEDTGCGLAGGTDLTGPLRLRPVTGAPPRVRVPLPESPLVDAIPAGACTATADQRGVPRPQAGRCEIGAVEVRPPQARDDSYQLQRGLIWTLHVLINDLDPDGQLPGATVTIDGTAGAGRFTVSGNTLRFEAPATVGPASATYRVCTLSGACSTATARVDVVAHPTPPPPAPPGRPPLGPATIGYWLLEADGEITPFGNVADLGDAIPAAGATAVAMAARPQRDGYWVLASDGDIIAVGGAVDFGAVDLGLLAEPGETLATIASSPTGGGLWVVTTSGRIVSFGDAMPAFAMTGADVVLALDLDGPVVDAAPTPSGLGMYMVGADGGVFTVGDAVFVQSLRGQLTQLFGPPGLPDRPVVGMVADPDGHGYWMVAEDGGVFSFDAPFRGSLPALVPFDRLVAPVNGMVPYGNGYVLVAGDGGTFVFSDLPFVGSGAGLLDDPVVGIATPR